MKLTHTFCRLEYIQYIYLSQLQTKDRSLRVVSQFYSKCYITPRTDQQTYACVKIHLQTDFGFLVRLLLALLKHVYVYNAQIQYIQYSIVSKVLVGLVCFAFRFVKFLFFSSFSYTLITQFCRVLANDLEFRCGMNNIYE